MATKKSENAPKFGLNDFVIWKRNSGSPLTKEAVEHIGQPAKIIGLYQIGSKPPNSYHIRFRDGYTINAFNGELTLTNLGIYHSKSNPPNIKNSKNIGRYGGGGKYHNCLHYVGSGKCVHPTLGDRKKGGSGICRYTAETEQKCPGYFGYDKYYSHSKGGKK
jgi:hypothetical protein